MSMSELQNLELVPVHLGPLLGQALGDIGRGRHLRHLAGHELVLGSAVKRSIGSTTGCTITAEKAPTRAFSWLKAPTSAFTFKTLC